MKILQVSCVFPPYRGGIGTVAFYFSKYLSLRGHLVSVLTPELENNKMPEKFDFSVDYSKGLLSLGKASVLFKYLKIYKNFDIIHLHYPFFGTAELVWLGKILTPKTKLVITYHMDFFPNTLGKKILALPANLIKNNLISRANAVTVSTFDYFKNTANADWLNKFKNKFWELPYSGKDNFSPGSKNEEIIQKLNLQNKKIVLFVGGLDLNHYFKGVPVLLKAFTLLPDSYALLIVGEGSQKKEYEELSKNFKISNKVKFLGGVSDELLLEYYRLSDCVVLPSINSAEAFGLVLIDAMACARPIIASDLPGVRTLISDSQNGYLFPVGSYEVLSDKIKLATISETEINRLGQNGLMKFKNNYSWDRIINNLENIYHSI